MVSQKVKIINPTGLHLRPSAKFTVFIFIGNIFFSQHSCHSPLLFTSYYYNN